MVFENAWLQWAEEELYLLDELKAGEDCQHNILIRHFKDWFECLCETYFIYSKVSASQTAARVSRYCRIGQEVGNARSYSPSKETYR